MIRFGPAGNSDSFYAAGFKSSDQAPGWLRKMGLSAYEYSFGRGVSLKEETAERIAARARENDIAVSAHAPYFINLSNPDPQKREASFRYIAQSARLLRLLDGERLVVHVGAAMKLERAEALKNCRAGLKEAYRRLDDLGLSGIRLCPETMGRAGQIGDLTETLDFCLLDERMIPCLDFAHLHARDRGALGSTEAFARVLDRAEQALGLDRARTMHIHFSTIEFTQKGEKRHRTFAETAYGPRFEHLAPLLLERGYQPRIICECHGTMAEDARAMQDIYENMEQKRREPHGVSAHHVLFQRPAPDGVL
ncbi:MAG: TIM barrel protein [Clostridia bacterium]|nr:TIM barrel protein [Clostridia bacterium]